MTIEPNNIKKLQQRNYKLVVENEFLKEQINTSQTSRLIAENNRLNEICIYWEKQYNELKQENEQLAREKFDLFIQLENIDTIKQQNTQLKHKNKQQAKTIERLITIITDEHYN